MSLPARYQKSAHAVRYNKVFRNVVIRQSMNFTQELSGPSPNTVKDVDKENEADFCSGSRETSERGTQKLRILKNSATQMLNSVPPWHM
jgi:hypothetical protein